MNKLIIIFAVSIFLIQPVFAEEVINPACKDDPAKCQIEETVKKEENSFQFGHVKQDEVFSTSNIQEQIKNSGSSIDVITLDDMKTLNNPAAKEVLNLLPGFSSYDSGSIGNITSFRIRGWNKSLLTLDGIRINDQNWNQPFLDNILTDDLERIEVIRGPQGTIHGTQAQGGLIGMFTRKGYGAPSIELNSGMGSFATFKENMIFQGGNSFNDYFLGITRLDTHGGALTAPDKKSRNDGYNNLSVSSNIGKRILKGRAEIRNVFRYMDAEKNIGTQWDGYPDYDPNSKSYTTSIFENLTFTHAPTDWYDYNVKFGTYRTRFKSLDPEDEVDTVYSYNRTDNTRLMLLTQHNLRYKNLNTFTYGYELEYNNFSTRSGGYGTVETYKDLVNNDVYFHDVINLKDTLFIRGGTRITTSSIWGTYATPNVSGALVFPTYKIPNSYTKFRSSYGYSITNPTPTQLYCLDWGGNPNLKPEKSNGWDIGMVQSFFNERADFEVGYFRNDIKDLIVWVPDDPSLWWSTGRNQNFEHAKTQGWEGSIKLKPVNGLKLIANYTYTDAKQEGQEILYMPRNRWNFLVNYNPNYRYNVYWKGISSSSRKASNSKTLKGFFDMAVGITAFLFKYKDVHVYAWAQLNNILDQNYEERWAMPHPGIHFMAGIMVKRAF